MVFPIRRVLAAAAGEGEEKEEVVPGKSEARRWH